MTPEEASEIIGTTVTHVEPVESLDEYLSACPEISSLVNFFAAHGIDKTLYHIGHDATGNAIVLRGCCQVLFDEVPLSLLVQYKFPDDDTWRVASLVEDAVQTYKAAAFASWEEQLRKPSCEAAFRRLLQAGPVSKIFDKHIFPTPPEMKSKYQVVNEKNGKLIDLPHPVERLRIWDEQENAFRDIDATLNGAPVGEAAIAYFAGQLEELKIEFGEDYIEGLLK